MADVAEVGARSESIRARWRGRWIYSNLVPITVVVLGVLSLGVLTWTVQISHQQRRHSELAYAIADFKLRLATAHLWLEEATAQQAAGETGTPRWQATMGRSVEDLHEARMLIDALVRGGPGVAGAVIAPFEDPMLVAHAEHVGELLAEWEAIAHQRSERPELGRVGSVAEQRSDAIFEDLQQRASTIERIVQSNKRADFARSRQLVLGTVVAWSVVVGMATTGLWHRERRRRAAENALWRSNDALERTVVERTRDLSLELGERRKAEAALRESEAKLRRLSAMLLTTQEAERRRIATELHDEVGHALILIKLRLGVVRKALRADQAEAKDDCQHLAQSIDQLIEELRRLTRDLRPTVLEDLGLAGALRWLADNFGKRDQLTVTASITDVDASVGADAQMILYRIVQEALTNVRKHAEARRVSLRVDRHDDELAVVVEDDGRGFDAAALAAGRVSDRGLGLTTMEERARMLGGSLAIASAAGKGTRVTLRVPVETAGGR